MRWKFVTWFTILATKLSDILLFKRKQKFQFEDYKKMPIGSLGRTYYNYLKSEKIKYRPNLIRHDLKHILLNYKMTMKDELRLHAFLLGNRSYNPLAVAHFLTCCLFVPKFIGRLRIDFNRGKEALRLKHIDLQRFVHLDLSVCRNKFNIKPLTQLSH